MSYKPLSQTVTDGQKNPISSDAVNDHVAAEIAAIPAGASLTLDNLTAPTAVNQDLNMGTNQLRFNSANRSSSISLNALDDVATGITTTVNNSTTVNTSASITDVLQIGDVIYLDGLAPRAVILTKPSATQITVSRPLGNGASKEIYIEPQLLSIFDSTTNRLSITKQGYFSFASPNSSLILKTSPQFVATGTANVIVGSGTTGNNITTGNKNTIIGASSGAALVSGASNTIIGADAGVILTGSSNTAIGVLANRFGTSGSDNITIGRYAGYPSRNEITLSAGSRNVYIGGETGPLSNTTAAQENSIALGHGAETSAFSFAIGSKKAPINNTYLGLGQYGISFQDSNTVKLTTHVASGTDTSTFGSFIIAGATSTGTGLGSAVVIATAPAGNSSSSTANNHKKRFKVDHNGKIGINTLNPQAELEVAGKVKVYNGDLEIETLGKGLKIAEGADATMGVATLAAGTATVSTSAVANNSRIMLSIQALGTVSDPKPMAVTGRTAGQDFTITSSDNTDTSEVAWMLINPLTGEDADASTFITNASITDATQKRAVHRFVKSLKEAGLWSKMIAIYPMVGGTETAHKLNLKDPQDSDAAFRLVFSSANVAHNSRGIKFGGVSPAYADTKVVPSTDFNSSQDFHISAYYFYDTKTYSGSFGVIGARLGGASTGLVLLAFDRAVASYAVNSNSFTTQLEPLNYTSSNRPHDGFFLLNSSASSIDGFMRTKEGDLIKIFTPAAPASAATSANSILINAYSDTNTVVTPNTGGFAGGAGVFKTMQCITIGDSLTNLETYNLYSIIEQLQFELGRDV